MQSMRKFWNRTKDKELNKKRVLMVMSTLNTGGAQRIFSNMMMEFPEDYQVDILLNDTENIVYPYKGTIIDLGLKPQSDKTKISYQMKVFLRRLRMLWKLKRQNHYDVCISALTSANVVNALTGCKGCKSILTVHSFMSKDSLSGLKKILQIAAIRLLYNWADIIAVVSESARRDLIRNFGVKEEKTITIYNGYPVREIVKAGQEALTEAEKRKCTVSAPKLVTAGRLTDPKGHWHLIRAMSRVKQQIPDSKLFILGDGELKDYLERLIRDYALEENVFLMGFMKNPYKIMANCDCFVLPSLYEGFPNVLVEAMALGLPCVSADFDSGAREILAPRTPISDKVKSGFQKVEYGILCPVCDGKMREAKEPLTAEEKDLADTLIEMFADPAVREAYGQKGKKRAQDLSIEKVIDTWKKLIEDPEA